VIAALSALMLAVVAAGFIYGYNSSVLAHQITISRFNVAFMQASNSSLNVELKVGMLNPSREAVTLSDVKYVAVLKQGNVRLGEVKVGRLTLEPGKVTPIILRLNVTSAELIREVMQALNSSNASMTVSMSAKVPVKWFGTLQYATTSVSSSLSKMISTNNLLLAPARFTNSGTGLMVGKPSNPNGYDILPFKVLWMAWLVHGKPVYIVRSGTEVTLQVTLRLTWDINKFPLSVCVIPYYAFHQFGSRISDHMICYNGNLSGKTGDVFVVFVNFKAEKTLTQGNLGKVGYYVALGEWDYLMYMPFPLIPPVLQPGPNSSIKRVEGNITSPTSPSISCELETAVPYAVMPKGSPPRLIVIRNDEPFYIGKVVWNVNGKNVTATSIYGTKDLHIKAYVTIVATKTLPGKTSLRLRIYADLKHAKDKTVLISEKKYVTLIAGHKYTLTASFDFNDVLKHSLSKSDLDRLRGFYVTVLSNRLNFPRGLPDMYPPRLKVLKGPLELIGTEWRQAGYFIGWATTNADVDAVLRFKALRSFSNIKVKVYIMQDRRCFFDKTVSTTTVTLTDVSAGQIITVKAPFHVDKKFVGSACGEFVDPDPGYYVKYKVYDSNGKLLDEWEMPNYYPPRLGVDMPFKLVSNAWTVDGHAAYKDEEHGHIVTDGAKVKLHAALRVESAINKGTIKFCVMKDLAYRKDKPLKCTTVSIHRMYLPDSIISVDITFYAKSEPHLRGYYLEYESKDFKIKEEGTNRLWLVKPSVSVSRVEWIANGRSISDVVSGTWVDAKVTVKAGNDLHSVPVTFCVRKDLAGRKDENVKCITKEITLMKGQEYTATISFQAHEEKHLRGYFIQVTSSKADYDWHQKSDYPPRLKLKPQQYVVSSVQWFVNGRSVDKVVENQDVTAKVILTSSTGLYEVPVSVCVRADRAGLPDENVKCITKTVTLHRGNSYTITIPFKAEHYARLRGYFIEVKSDLPDFSWHQESKYPPRLEYVSPSFRVVEVVWLPNNPMASPVTSVRKDTWVYARVTIHTDTGLANARITFCVREDIAHASDKDKACVTKTINLPAGGEYSVLIHFKATYYRKFFAYTRGYFIEVKSDNPHYKWTMPNHYPPRLKVRK